MVQSNYREGVEVEKHYDIDFKKGKWTSEIDVEDFITLNYTYYEGDESFLEGISKKTNRVWLKCLKLIKQEVKTGSFKIDLEHIAGINTFKPGYINKKDEVIVGLQTDQPLKRIINPYGGIKLVEKILEERHLKLNPMISLHFTEYTKTHNQGVFDAYTKEIKLARKTGLITGLPDAYGRGRIIGDYRRVPLYGIDFLIKQKEKDLDLIVDINDETIQIREEVADQIKALNELKQMAATYGFDISKPAKNSKEAVQWLYFAYLATVKENNGAAMSLGRTSTFLDIYFERDLINNQMTEKEIQELVDQFIIKLRVVRHLRSAEYDELFAGDPTWVTESIGGCTKLNKPLITKNSFRYLHTLDTLGPSPEPNLTILWSKDLPISFKKYAAKMSIKTGAIQYENDDLMRPIFGDDYAIACCVSAMTLSKQMQYFGARANLAKALLYAINGGVDEMTHIKVMDGIKPINDELLDYDIVLKAYKKVLSQLAKTYVNAMNIIHFMHDKYAYEWSLMALHDTFPERLMAFGIAGLSVVADSLSAIKYAKVKPIRNHEGITTKFEIEGDFPKYGNDDDRVDDIAIMIAKTFYEELKKHSLHRKAKHTLSVLTITSNVVYGLKTGATPDGREAKKPFAPGANPLHGRDRSGALASLNSVSKLPYKGVLEDGISNTFSIVPQSLGKDKEEQINNLTTILDGYFKNGGHHLNVNVLNRETLIRAMKYPDENPTLTIRVSGYAVHFNRLTKQQQEEVINRTFHEEL